VLCSGAGGHLSSNAKLLSRLAVDASYSVIRIPLWRSFATGDALDYSLSSEVLLSLNPSFPAMVKQ